MLRFVITVLLVFSNSFVTAKVLHKTVQSFVQHGLVPDVMDSPPAEVLKVTFPGEVEVLGGNVLTISEVADPPTLEWSHRSGHYYTLVMADADPPSRVNPEARSFLHWLVINIPEGVVSMGQTITNRLRSNPEPGTGLHRYYFLVFEQQGYIEGLEQDDSFEKRVQFSPNNFADQNNMDIIAGNFYQTENVESL